MIADKLRIDDIAASGDRDLLWSESSKIIWSWVRDWKRRKRVTMDPDDLFGEASLKFVVCLKSYKPGMSWLAFLKTCVYRHWGNLMHKEFESRDRARIDLVPTSRRAQFGLPEDAGSRDHDEDGNIVVPWYDRQIAENELSDECEIMLSRLTDEDAAILRDHANGKPWVREYSNAIARAKKILSQRDQLVLY